MRAGAFSFNRQKSIGTLMRCECSSLGAFLFVAKHGGISAAVRHIPYGIQQPAVSGQILQLEEYLGQKLFQRRPFLLTPAGERLFRFIQPFFENLELVSDELRGQGGKKLRLAASTAWWNYHWSCLFIRRAL